MNVFGKSKGHIYLQLAATCMIKFKKCIYIRSL